MDRILFCNKNQLSLIQKLAHDIWPQVYDYMISASQIEFMLNKMYSMESLEIQWQEGHQFLLLESENQFLGFASFQTTTSGNAKLHKLYLKKQSHGKGWGKKLLVFIENQCRNQQQTSIQLNVNRNNKSLNFYLANGFQIQESIDIPIGDGFEMNDFIMQKSIL